MKLSGKKILVTGGAGFIGSHIVESLVEHNAHVTVYDNFSTGRSNYLSRVIKDINIVKGNILDFPALEKACRNVDAISHHAAQLEIFRSIDDPQQDLITNTVGTLNVLKAAHKHNVSKIINASSAAVYGQAEQIPENEEHEMNPHWPYGVSKLAAEKYCSIYHQDHGISITNLRYAIVYGEREWFGRVLTIFLKRAIEGKPPVIFGDGSQLRDFVYVKDVVSAHNLCLSASIANDSFNVASGTGTSIKKLAKLIADMFLEGTSPIHENVKEGQMSRYVAGRRRIPGELRKLVMDITKIKRKLGWKPQTSLRDGIKMEMNWARTNRDSWKTEKMRV
ncbi:MAG: GDP-mannose 4,6-dehydratase, partial [Nitrososphaerales archaeon]